jgi:hypothetical protein
MPVNYSIDSGVIVVEMKGRVTASEFLAYLQGTDADPAYRPGMPRLVLIDPEVDFPSSPEIVAQARNVSQRALPKDVRFACVATSPLAIGIASMFMGNAGLSENYRIFFGIDDARRWVGLPVERPADATDHP